ncbi:MAG: Cof-type HAD-IIB family hydrolase [Anaerostipes faecalis]|nr:Cof-type HAD-IIB family hydrolase [Anaerostipes faecalis]
MSIKVILMDVDGTLADSSKKITPETKTALLQAQDAGILLVLASGRTDNGLKYFADELNMKEHHGLLICNNGATVVDYQTGEILFSQALSVEEGKEVLEHLKKFDVCPVVARGEYMYVNNVFNNTIERNGKPWNVLEYESRGNNYKLCEIDDLAKWCDFEISKILTYANPSYLQENYEEMKAPFGDRINSMFTAPYYYEFTAKGVDKSKAIRKAIEISGFTADEMIAFGDAQNDKTMIEYAGIGVAMGNATDELKAAADYITDDMDHDGIAKTLYHFFPEIYK